jgi:putative spermidine/putrescine transport system substrate-binding protein
MRMRLAIASVLVAVMAIAAGCGSSSSDSSNGGTGSSGGGSSLPTSIGTGEGALNLIAWEGYVEDGSNDKSYDWVTPFEKNTGCQVKAKYAGSSDEMVTLMKSGQYDGVSASGDASNRLIAGGDVVEINTDLIPDFADISPALQSPPHNTVDDKHYGVSYAWGANVLMYNTKEVSPAPTSWDVVFDGTSYKGKVTAYDSPIYIADAALYLKATQPDLGITDPYELTEDQLNAAVELLKKQRPQIGKYWGFFSDEIQFFKQGDAVIGTAWPYQVNALKADKQPVEAVLPEEGATGWADTWMMSSQAAHPNCMYEWMAWATTPEVQKGVAEWFGAAPANPKACDLLGKQFCDDYHVTDQSYFDQIAFWKTPLTDCGDDRGTTCTDYSVWTQKWAEIKG